MNKLSIYFVLGFDDQFFQNKNDNDNVLNLPWQKIEYLLLYDVAYSLSIVGLLLSVWVKLWDIDETKYRRWSLFHCYRRESREERKD